LQAWIGEISQSLRFFEMTSLEGLNYPINKSTYQQINLSTNQQINPSTNQPINKSTYQQINKSTHQQINPPTPRLRRARASTLLQPT
jgi:predicted molibdopterin-dependent oxidoreductase YjgC